MDLLDDFNRADEDPLSGGGNWAAIEADGAAKIVSNMVRNNNASTAIYSGSYWTPAQASSADCEVQVTVGMIEATTSFNIRLYLRVTTPGGSQTGYCVQFNRGVSWCVIRKMTARGTFTTLATLSNGSGFTTGDILKFGVVGDTLTAYKNGTSVLTTNDSTYSAAGYVGFALQGSRSGATGLAIDDFSATNVATSAHTDSATVTSTTTPYATDQADTTDTPTVTTVTTPDVAEVYTSGASEYTDAATVGGTTTPTGSDTAQFLEPPVVVLTQTAPAVTENYETTDSAIVGSTTTMAVSEHFCHTEPKFLGTIQQKWSATPSNKWQALATSKWSAGATNKWGAVATSRWTAYIEERALLNVC